jgi:hypothetical protein
MNWISYRFDGSKKELRGRSLIVSREHERQHAGRYVWTTWIF